MPRNSFKVIVAALVMVGAGPAAPAGAQQGSAQAPPVATCPHTIEAAKCPFCDPSRIERLGTCTEHGGPEALCVKCKPFMKAAFIAVGDWCKEHETPESQCELCNPQAAAKTNALAHKAGIELRWEKEPSLACSTSSTPVTLTGSDVAKAIGLEFSTVQAKPLSRTFERNAELAYNTNRYARLSSRAPGIVAEVLKDLGEPVKKGDILVIIDSVDVGIAKSDLLLGLETMKLWTANAARERGLVEKGIGVVREAMEAETKAAEGRIGVNRARQRLRTLGLTPEQIASIESKGDTSSLLELAAPFDGLVVERAAVVGESADPGRTLLGVADTTTIWAMVDLAETDLTVVQVGQRATVMLDGLPGRPVVGTVTWLSTQVDPRTRTLKARVELDNSQGMLRANMFGRATVRASENRQAVTVPKGAVQWEGCCNVAFVRTGTGATFQPARLTLGYDAGDRYEVVSGLKAGDEIVTGGSYLLKNELLKNSVGAGCCEIDHLKK